MSRPAEDTDTVVAVRTREICSPVLEHVSPFLIMHVPIPLPGGSPDDCKLYEVDSVNTHK
jgi:hypothetical protein